MRSLSLSPELRLRTLPGTAAAFNGPGANGIDQERISAALGEGWDKLPP
jgi:hypothetical protein